MRDRCVPVLGALALLLVVAPVASAQVALNVGFCVCSWDNGDYDSAGGQLALQEFDGTVLGEVADDFFLRPGTLNRIDNIFALMLTDSDAPDAIATLYRDCNGKPGDVIASFPSTSAVDTGIDKDELDLYEIGFVTGNCRLEGGQLYWIGFRGVRTDGGSEEYQLATAGSSVVQAVQGQYLLPDQGAVDWTPIDTTNLGKTDFAFAICADECDVLYDGGEADYIIEYPVEINQALANYRSSDDISLPPCAEWEIDVIRACVLTNCELTTVEVELWDQDPETCMPGMPLMTASATKREPLGVSVSTTEVVPMVVDAISIDFGELGWVVEGGKTYWVSIVAEGTGALRDRTFVCASFDCNKGAECQTKAGPAKFFKPSVGLWEGFGSFLGDEVDRELAIIVCGRRVEEEPPDDPIAAIDCPCDWNEDGNFNDQDWFDFASDYFQGLGARGHSDYNQDGNQNDQDWFDFANCYLNPPEGCTAGGIVVGQ